MARLYADEDFDLKVVVESRRLGHDVLTVQEAGQGGRGIGDDEVLVFASTQGRAVVTFNRIDFIHLHRTNQPHGGMVACTRDRDRPAWARRIDQALLVRPALINQLTLIRVNRPHSP